MQTHEVDLKARNFSAREAAAYLRFSESFIWKLIRRGALKATRVGRRTIITGSAIAELLEQNAA